MQVLFINNDGGGFATQIDVPDGTTVGQLFERQMSGRDSADYLIRVDRQPAAADEPLRHGCRVSFTPTKIDGAAGAVAQSLPPFRRAAA